MVKREEVFVASLFFLIVFSLSFAIAVHTITTNAGTTTFTTTEDVEYKFNITVNNSESGATGQLANITIVNITIPSTFNFNATSNNTNSSSVFSNTTRSLVWTNDSGTFGYVINGSNISSFIFNATPSTPGTYNLIVATTNVTGTFSTNISVIVNDTTSPNITLNLPADGEAGSIDALATYGAYNFTFNVTDNSTIHNCSLIFDDVVVYTILTPGGTSTENGFYNQTLSPTATYVWEINCTDKDNNRMNTTARTLSLSVASTTSPGGGSPAAVPKTWTKTIMVSAEQFTGGYSKTLRSKERIRVSVGGGTHHIGVKEVTASTVTIEVASDPQTATLSVGDERKFNVDGDSTYDIYVKLNSISGNEADVTIKEVDETITAQTEQDQQDADDSASDGDDTDDEEEDGSKAWIWIVVVVIVVLIILGGGYGLKKYNREI